jgi:hypothetical protein
VLEPETERSREDLVTGESEDGSTDRTAEPETSQHVAAVHTIGRESRWEESASQGRELREFKLPQLTERETARQRQREREGDNKTKNEIERETYSSPFP